MTSIAAIVTWRRPRELGRLLESLAGWEEPPALAVVADHAPDGRSQEIARAAKVPTRVLENPGNPGPGAGWTRAAREGLLAVPHAEAVWFLDDDVVVGARAASRLLALLKNHGLAAPLLEDAGGKLWAFPEPLERGARRDIRRARTPSDAQRLLGPGPHPLCWCTGACVAVAAPHYRRTGPHRPDFFMLGEDLEFSMRAAAEAGEAVFACDAVVAHLPPASPGSSQAEKIKFCALLQNLAWLSFHSPHSRHMKRYLPGNIRRFARTFGLAGLPLALECVFYGALAGEPAGGRLGAALRGRLQAASSSV